MVLCGVLASGRQPTRVRPGKRLGGGRRPSGARDVIVSVIVRVGCQRPSWPPERAKARTTINAGGRRPPIPNGDNGAAPTPGPPATMAASQRSGERTRSTPPGQRGTHDPSTPLLPPRRGRLASPPLARRLLRRSAYQTPGAKHQTPDAEE